MNQSFHLNRLQRIDSLIDQVDRRSSEIQEILAGDSSVTKAAQRLSSAIKTLETLKSSLRALEYQAQEIRVKITQSESNLYGGKIKNPKELQDLEKEIVLMRKNLQVIEDQQLNLMIQVEEAEADLKHAQFDHQTVYNEFMTKQSVLIGERDQLQKKRLGYIEEKSSIMPAITPEYLMKYSELRRTKHIAVARVEEGTCSICGSSLTPADCQAARSPHTVVFCSSCGRILYSG